MKLADISIKNPVFAWMLMFSLMLFGAMNFFDLGIGQMPDVDFPMVTVSVTYEGAAPEVMELDVIDPIESAIMSVAGVKSITSSAKQGSASITVEFNIDKDIDLAVSEVETKMSQAARRLPENIDPPSISKMNVEDRPILWLGVSSDRMSIRELMLYVRDHLRDQFQTVDGVSDIFLGGYVEPNLRVWVDDKKLTQYELSVQDVISAIQTEHNETPSGFIETPVQELNVRTLGEALSVKEFNKLPLIRRGGAPNYSPLFLEEVAFVEEGLDEVRRKSRVMGKTAIGIGIRKQRGANTVSVASDVKKKMVLLQKSLPEGMDMGINYDSTTFIENSIHELNTNMILSALLTAVVCWLFLGSLSSTVNVILSIPTSILGAFIFLNWLGFTLNTFTLLGLSLAIGIVVDDAIMVLENIFRHFEMGKNRVDASRDGAREITFAALAATVSIMAIFLPVAFMDGIIGKYFYQFGVTLSVAVGLSYIEALTLTPMRTSQMMSKSARATRLGHWVDKVFESWINWYEKCLAWVLKNRMKTLLVSFVFFAGTFVLVKWIPREMVPAQDTSTFMVRLKTKEGSSLAFTDNALKGIEDYFMKRQEVKKYFASIGGFGGGESNTAMLFVTLHPPKNRKPQQVLMEEYRAYFNQNFKLGRVFISDNSQAGFSASGRGFPIEFTITGPEWGELANIAKSIMTEMRASESFSDVDTDYKESVEEVHLIPNREAAKIRGVSVADIGRTVSALVGGTVVGKYSQGGHRYDIRIKLKDNGQPLFDRISKLHIRNLRGELLSLSDVVSVEKKPGVQSITRRDRSRAISIFSNVKLSKSQADAMDEAMKIAGKNVKEGYKIVQSGASESMRETSRSLMIALVLGIVIAYMILGSQFNSFLDPLTVLLALPFSFSGAFIGLYLTHSSLNIYSMIGLILLMGIVKKNSILLVDFTHQKRDEGMEKDDALMHACPQRLRPILMTSFATIAGAVPLALSIGAGSEALKPMAVAVIGGTFVSTFLTLIVVPAFYSLVSRRKMRAHE